MKRGSSGLSLVVGINKPVGMSSHDVVNQCRRIFNERRVGHTGTLDPLASGVLPICVGPATRLDPYLTGHEKSYRVKMAFGFETDTDDSEGKLTVQKPIPDDLLDGEFADAYVQGLIGTHQQMPPQYSAIKIDGKKAYDLARAGKEVKLEPRTIEIKNARLIDRYSVDEPAPIRWTMDFTVSKGTYIRSLVRDIGRELGCAAHMVALERTCSGALDLATCISLETLETLGVTAALDPLRLLGIRFAYGDDLRKEIENGHKLESDQVSLFEFKQISDALRLCSCMGETVSSKTSLKDEELIGVILDNRLKSLYRYSSEKGLLVPECVFSTAIARN